MAIAFMRGFIARIDIAPSTLTLGTIYWTWRNTTSNPGGATLYVKRIWGNLTFTGTAAATRSIFGVHRKAGTPTGGTSTPPTILNSGAVAGINEVRFANAGLGGVTLGANDQFATFAKISQLTTENVVDLEFEGENALQVEAGEFFCIYAHAALIAGVGFNGHALVYAN